MKRPYIPAGCDNQGRLIDGQRIEPAECGTELGADMPGIRAPLPNSVGRWARVLIGGVVLLFAVIGAVSLLSAAVRQLSA